MLISFLCSFCSHSVTCTHGHSSDPELSCWSGVLLQHTAASSPALGCVCAGAFPQQCCCTGCAVLALGVWVIQGHSFQGISCGCVLQTVVGTRAVYVLGLCCLGSSCRGCVSGHLQMRAVCVTAFIIGTLGQFSIPGITADFCWQARQLYYWSCSVQTATDRCQFASHQGLLGAGMLLVSWPCSARFDAWSPSR